MCLAISVIPIGIIGGFQGFQSDESAALIALIFGVTFCISFLISYFITQPIEKLTKNIDEISKGKLDVQLSYGEINEMNNLTDSLNRVMASLKLAIHKVGVKKGEIFEDAVKAKEEYDQKQRDLLNSIKGWAWEIDTKGNFIFASENASEVIGYNSQELIGKNLYNLIDTSDVKSVKQAFTKSAKNQKPVKNLENWNKTKNNERICVLTNAFPFFDENDAIQGFRGVNTDITNEQNAKNKIKKLNNELSSIKIEITELLNERDRNKDTIGVIPLIKKQKDEAWSEHEFDSVLLLDEDANILDCNEKMYKQLGYSKSEILSLNLADIDALETKKDIVNKIKKAKKAGSITFKTIHKRKDGSAILVEENLQYIQEKNEFKSIIREDYAIKKNNN